MLFLVFPIHQKRFLEMKWEISSSQEKIHKKYCKGTDRLQLSKIVVFNKDCSKYEIKHLEYIEIFIFNSKKHVNETSRNIQILFQTYFLSNCANIVLIKGLHQYLSITNNLGGRKSRCFLFFFFF